MRASPAGRKLPAVVGALQPTLTDPPHGQPGSAMRALVSPCVHGARSIAPQDQIALKQRGGQRLLNYVFTQGNRVPMCFFDHLQSFK